VEDNLAPVITLTNPFFLNTVDNIVYIECELREDGWEYPILSSADFTVTDNCSEVSVTIREENTVTNDCANLGYLMQQFYTITATDACGNQSQLVIELRLIDTEAPVLRGVPANVTVSCDNIPVAPALGDCLSNGPNTVWADDSCGCPEVTFAEQIVMGNCPSNYNIIRTWTSVDPCGNVATAQQIIQVRDTEGPIWVTVPDELYELPTGSVIDIQCGNEGNTQWLNQLGSGSFVAVDGCSGISNVTFASQILDGGNCQAGGAIESRLYRWIATDACGNSTVYEVTVRYVDTEGPVISGPEVACSNNPSQSGVSAVDQCSEVIVLDYDDFFVEEVCGTKVYDRVWYAIDACYNQSTFTQKVYENLNAAPQIVFPVGSDLANPNFTELSVGCKETQYADFYLSQPFEVIGNCADLVSSGVTSETVELEDCNQGVIRREILTWTATDVCGNTATRTLTIEYTDNTRPIFVNNNKLVEVECYEDASVPNAIDACSEVTLNLIEARRENEICSGRYDVVETWVALDACGNQSRWQRVVRVNKTTGPIITNILPALCQGQQQPTPVVENVCGTTFEITVQSGTSDPNVCGYYNFSTRIYTITDDCGNSNSYSQQIITGNNATALQIENAVLGNIQNGITYTMECSSAGLNLEQVFLASDIVTGDLCYGEASVAIRLLMAGTCQVEGHYGIYEVIYRWTNECGIDKFTRARVRLVPSTQPMATFVPQDAEVFCNDSYVPEELEFVSYCDQTTVTYSETEEDYGNSTVVVRSWVLQGNCGQVETYTQRITYYNDSREVKILVNNTVNCNDINFALVSIQGQGNFQIRWEIVRGDAIINGPNDRSRVAFFMGWAPFTLRVTVMDEFGCVSTDEIEVRCTFEVDIRSEENPASLATLELYPNPTSAILNVEWRSEVEEMLTYHVIDRTGRIVRTGRMAQLAGNNLQQIEVYDLPSGVYFLQMVGEQQTVVMKTFVKIN
jgi:large repetitive protein